MKFQHIFVVVGTLLLLAETTVAGEIVSHNGINVDYATTGTGDVDVSLDNDYTYPFSPGNTDGARLTKIFYDIDVHSMEVLAAQHISLQPELFVPPETPAAGIDSTFEQIFNQSSHSWESYHLSWSGPSPVSIYTVAAAYGPSMAQELDGNTFNIVFDAPLEIGGFFYVQLNFLIDPFLVGEIPDGEYGGDDGLPDGLVWDYRWTLTQYAVPHTPVVGPPPAVPEPSTLMLLSSFALSIAGYCWRGGKKKVAVHEPTHH